MTESMTRKDGIELYDSKRIYELERDLALKGLQVEAMREAIRRIADQTPDEQTRRYALETLAGLAASPEREEGNMSANQICKQVMQGSQAPFPCDGLVVDNVCERCGWNHAPRAAEAGEDAELARFLVAGDLSIMFHDGKGRSLSVEEKVTILNALCASSSPAIDPALTFTKIFERKKMGP